MEFEHYESLLNYLSTAAKRKFLPHGEQWDCNAEEDPYYPAPQDNTQLYNLLQKLPLYKHLVLCAVTASEMIMPIWKEWKEKHLDEIIYDNVPNNLWEAPEQAIEIAEAFTHDEINMHQFGIEVARLEVRDLLAVLVSTQTIGEYCVTATAFYYPFVSTIGSAGKAYALAVNPNKSPFHHFDLTIGHSWERFIKRWWEICRCRLAFQL